MSTAAVASFGALLKVGDGGSPENFTTIAELLTISGPKMQADEADVTSFSSTGGWHERIATLLDGGEITCTANWIPQDATQDYTAGILHRFVSKVKQNYRIVFNDVGATTWTFPAWVFKVDTNLPLDKQMQFGFTLRITGQPTLA